MQIPERRVIVQTAIEGSDGWLFLDGDSNRSVDQFTGKLKLTDRAAAAWDTHFSEAKQLAQELDFKFVQLFAPSKESVYSDKYPYSAEMAAVRPIHDVLARVPDGVPAIFPVEELKEKLGRNPAYDKGDTHWNPFGAGLAAELVIRALGRAMPPIDTFLFVEKAMLGDLDSKIPGREPGLMLQLAKRHAGIKVLFDSELHNRGRVVVMHNPVAPEGTVVMFADSFGHDVRDFLVHCFQRTVFVHANSIDAELVRLENPDAVVAEMAERFVILPPQQPSSFRIVDLLSKKLITLPEHERDRLRDIYRVRAEGPERNLAEVFLRAVDV
jgi:hypothetical protein